MRKVKKSSFDSYVDSFCDMRKTFIVESKRNIESLHVNNQMVLMTKNKNKRFNNDSEDINKIFNIFGQVQKNVNKYLKQVQFDVKTIEQRYKSSKTNKAKWREIERGEIFYYLDVKHCFWRIAFLKGYISKNLYVSVLNQDDLKVQRNMSLALIVAPKTRKYYDYGKKVLEIEEERSMYRTIYDNIRFSAYNIMGDCMTESLDDFIAYRTDGIMIKKDSIESVSKIINDAGLNFTIEECAKIDSKNYLKGNKIKKL